MTRTEKRKWKLRMLQILVFEPRTRSQITRLTGRMKGPDREKVLHNVQHRGLVRKTLLPASEKGGFEAEQYSITDKGRLALSIHRHEA